MDSDSGGCHLIVLSIIHGVVSLVDLPLAVHSAAGLRAAPWHIGTHVVEAVLIVILVAVEGDVNGGMWVGVYATIYHASFITHLICRFFGPGNCGLDCRMGRMAMGQ
jgi:hypothetical protein